jgi:hypothetical protein
LHVVESDPAPGAGLDCDPSEAGCGVATNTTIRLRFDRFLLPESAVRQSLSVYLGVPSNPALAGNTLLAELSPRYDPASRSVNYAFPDGFLLKPRVVYTVLLPIYTDEVPYGFRAFDGAPLEGTEPLRFVFFTGSGPATTPPSRPGTPSCQEIAAFFAADCASCHGERATEPAPRMGLSLAGWDAIRATAIGKVAHETDVADTTGVTNQAPPRFGVNMPIIDPERPDNSYLVYKLLLSEEAYLPSDEDDCLPPAACEAPDPAELERLRAWFLRGSAMPASPGPVPVRHAEIAWLESFIEAGATCP